MCPVALPYALQCQGGEPSSSRPSLMHVSGRLRLADGAVNAGQPLFDSSFGVGGRMQGALGCQLHVGSKH